MSETKHTPGPWTAIIDPASDWGPARFNRLVDPQGKTVRFSGVTLSSGEEAESNTMLSGAALDMLEAGRDVLAAFDPDAMNPEQFIAWNKLTAAIAKAEGRS